MNKTRNLHQLASLYGIESCYTDVFNKSVKVNNNTLLKLLNSLGVSIKTEKDLENSIHQFKNNIETQVLDLVTVCWEKENRLFSLYLPETISNSIIKCSVQSEYDKVYTWDVDAQLLEVIYKHVINNQIYIKKNIFIPDFLETGYYDLTIICENFTFSSFLLIAPNTCYQHSDKKTTGIFAPIYALHSNNSYGCGDLRDFKSLITWANELDLKFVGTLPLYSSDPYNYSPYSPLSRLFWNDMFVEINVSNNSKPLQQSKIDYAECYNYKKKLIYKWIKESQENSALKNNIDHFIANKPFLIDYAKYCSQFETDINYTYFIQYQLHEQLYQLKDFCKNLKMKLYLDFPLGVAHNSFDRLYFSNEFIPNANIGSPPDLIFPEGQNWNLAPLHPINIRKNKYKYFISCLRTIMPLVDILRIDHVMAFHRLYVIPDELPAKEGTYINYNYDEFYAILCIESIRYQVEIVGENLGTTPPQLNNVLDQHDINQMYILQYELDSKNIIGFKDIPKKSLTALNTHDMPTFAKYYQQSFNNIDRLNEINRLRKMLHKNKLLDSNVETVDEKDYKKFLFACLAFLAKSSSHYFLINIEDLWQETIPQNTPSTPANENWRQKLRYSLEEIKSDDRLTTIIYKLNSLRQEKQLANNINSKSLVDYSFSLLSADDLYWFNEGKHFRLYRKLGAHFATHNNQLGVYFAVWAPNAKTVSVMGDFNDWQPNKHYLRPCENSGIWEGFIPGIPARSLYKFSIVSKEGLRLEKSDPFAFYCERAPKTASVIWDLHYLWNDDDWMKNRSARQNHRSPISIYEVHLGSWMRIPEENNRYLTYREIAEKLTDYILQQGYTHIELLPIMEHPFYGSWGYQVTGYFAPTSRYGSPQDFMYLIDYLHQHNIGVILDWVPSHFPNDQHGLAKFDGTYLFEHEDPRQGFHPDWKSAIFNYGRNEVQSFLISNALFWFDYYHIDAIRVDAVASMLYLDYSRKEGEWVPNIHGGRENLSAISFLKSLNETVYHNYPDVQIIAEESTAWAGVSKPTYLGGLGFGFKWDMGWMHDTLLFLKEDPIYRQYKHNMLTFRMLYAFTENFILSLSHDETVHGKGSLINKMSGYDLEKFANVRLLFGYMFGLPGKKLLFMGMDFAQWREWDHSNSLDWNLIQYAPHRGMQNWVKQLNEIYKHEDALYETDCDFNGFEWIDCNNYQQSILIFLRKNKIQNSQILVVINATPVSRENYRIGIPMQGQWTEIANSNHENFGGNKSPTNETYVAETIPMHDKPYSISINIDGLSTVFYKWKI